MTTKNDPLPTWYLELLIVLVLGIAVLAVASCCCLDCKSWHRHRGSGGSGSTNIGYASPAGAQQLTNVSEPAPEYGGHSDVLYKERTQAMGERQQIMSQHAGYSVTPAPEYRSSSDVLYKERTKLTGAV
jgi:hypothetical protein